MVVYQPKCATELRAVGARPGFALKSYAVAAFAPFKVASQAVARRAKAGGRRGTRTPDPLGVNEML